MNVAARKRALPIASRADYPWDDCMADAMKRYGDEETAKKVCGAIKAGRALRAGTGAVFRASTDVASVDKYTRSATVVASTPNPVEGVALAGWDLERYQKNPAVLWSHDPEELPIGRAEEVSWDPAVGLVARIVFAPEKANPQAERVFQSLLAGTLRAVSVGYDVGSLPDGARSVPAAELAEISFVAVGADEDAGTSAVNPAAPSDEESEEWLAQKASNAARDLALHQARKRKALAATTEVRTDEADAPGTVHRMDRGPISLGKIATTPSGGRVVPARLSRTGVLRYMNADGTVRRELRLDAEIFKAESLATLEHAPVIDIANHTGMITPDTWRKAALGHVSNVRRDGKFIVADLVINDGATLDAIERGERAEISCGYRCRLDWTPGTHEGEEYDCVQRDVRYNHAALCPPNRGRAGPEVGLRLDEKTPWAIAHFDNQEEIVMIKVRLDGKEYEEGSREHLDAIDRVHAAEVEATKKKAKEKLEAVEAEKADLQKRLDASEGASDAAAKEVEALKLDAKTKAADVEKALADVKKGEDARVLRKVRMMRMAMRFFGKDDDDDKDGDDDEKMDGMTEREIQVRVVKKHDPKFSDEGKSDDYVLSRFDAVCDFAKKERGVDGVARAAHVAGALLARHDAGDASDPVAAARKKRDEHAANAWRENNGQAGK